MKLKKSGFTLIELLVVISIIAILSVIGITIYSNVTNNARDTKKRADVDAIAAAYEQHYDPSDSKYPTLQDEWFGSGGKPQSPEGNDYSCLLTQSSPSFKICTALSNGEPYCRGSALGDPVSCTIAQSGSSGNPSSTSSSNPAPTSSSLPSHVSTSAPQPTPTAKTENPTDITQISAKLNGFWTLIGSSNQTWFQYGTVTEDCRSLPNITDKFNWGNQVTSSNANWGIVVSSLSANTNYFFCAVASNSEGTSYGEVLQFKTLPVLTLIPQSSTYKRIFTLRDVYTGSLGGLNGADTKCQQKADGSGLGGIWKAWLSDSRVSANDRLTHFDSAQNGYRLVDGVVIADNWNDLTDGAIKSKLNKDEKGIEISTAGSVWTNTRTNGSIQYVLPQPSQSCYDWTSATGANYTYNISGNMNRIDVGWTDITDIAWGCGNTRHLYCFEQ